MVSQATLRLVKPEDSDVIPLERRQDTRYVVSGRVTAVETQDSDDHRNKICSLQLLNMSNTGLCALSQEPVSPGSRIAVLFPAHGPEHGFDLYGEVVRCVPRECGHEVGVRFQARLMAA